MRDERNVAARGAIERGPEVERDRERKVREAAYRIWEREGRPDGRA